MSDKTAISWTGSTWNPVKGCEQISPGCRNCYAKHQAARIVRMSKGKPSKYDGLVKIGPSGDPCWTGEGLFDPDALKLPLTWRTPRRILVDSMSDLFFDAFTNEQIAAVFGVMAACPQHQFQVLTKRAKRMREWFEWASSHGDGHDLMRFGPSALLTCAWEACSGDVWGDIEPPGVLESLPTSAVFGATWPLPNVWIGVSVENQAAADERIPELLRTPAAVRFLSCEPLLGSLALRDEWMLGRFMECPDEDRGDEVDPCAGCPAVPNDGMRGGDYCGAVRGPRLDWIIGGCESGPGARPCDVDWLRSLRDQCASAGVPFFLKQAAGYFVPPDGAGMQPPARLIYGGPGSKRKPGGVIELPYLDGLQHAAFPEVSHEG